MRIGYIGLGALGGELARRLLREHRLTVWDASARAIDALSSAGASAAASAAEVARDCDVVLLCLPRSSDVRQVVFGPGGLAEGLSPGKLVIDQTSGFPGATLAIAQELTARGVDTIDAAVSASPHVVAAGAAILMAGASDAAFERVLPVLRAITSTIYRCGTRVGDGQAMKIVNNAMNAACRLGTLEVVAMGRKAGLSLEQMTEALNQGSGRNQTTDKMLPALVQGKASTNFALSLMVKDMNQAVLLGLDAGTPMPICNTVRSLLQIGLNTLGPGAGLEDMVGVIESMAGTRIAHDGGGDANATNASASQHETERLATLSNALTALGCAVTYECVVTGLKHGLAIDAMADVLVRTSGWSASAQAILPCVARNSAEVPLDIDLSELAGATTLALDLGAPLTIAAVVQTLFAIAENQFRDGPAASRIASFYAAAGKVNLCSPGGSLQ